MSWYSRSVAGGDHGVKIRLGIGKEMSMPVLESGKSPSDAFQKMVVPFSHLKWAWHDKVRMDRFFFKGVQK